MLEGGFDDAGTFYYIPFSGLDSMIEVFRRRVVGMLMDRGLLKADLAKYLLSWKHSGFSIDNSVTIFDDQARENVAEYGDRADGRTPIRTPFERKQEIK